MQSTRTGAVEKTIPPGLAVGFGLGIDVWHAFGVGLAVGVAVGVGVGWLVGVGVG